MCSLIKGVTAFMAWTMSPPRWTLAVRYCAQSDGCEHEELLCPLMMTTDGFQTLFSVRKEHRARPRSARRRACCRRPTACVWGGRRAPRGGGGRRRESACGSPPASGSRAAWPRELRPDGRRAPAPRAPRSGRGRRGPASSCGGGAAPGRRRRGDGQPEVEGARWLRHGREHRRRIGVGWSRSGTAGAEGAGGAALRARHLGLWL